MSKPLVSDEFWELVQPLLPPQPPKPKGGRPRIPDRQVLSGILFVLKTGIGWEDLPKEMDCGSGMTCWRRLRDWHQSGVWERIHLVCLERLQAAAFHCLWNLQQPLGLHLPLILSSNLTNSI